MSPILRSHASRALVARLAAEMDGESFTALSSEEDEDDSSSVAMRSATGGTTGCHVAAAAPFAYASARRVAAGHADSTDGGAVMPEAP